METGVNDFDMHFLHYTDPTCAMETMFCLHHGLAAAILKGNLDWKYWSDEGAVDPAFKDARSKIHVVHHPEWPPDQKDSRSPITLKLKDGRVFTEQFAAPINPNRQELIERYRLCTESVLSKEAVDRSIDLILNLDKVRDVSELMDSVRGG